MQSSTAAASGSGASGSAVKVVAASWSAVLSMAVLRRDAAGREAKGVVALKLFDRVSAASVSECVGTTALGLRAKLLPGRRWNRARA